MNKWLLGLIVIVVLAGLILVLIKRLQTSGSGVLYRSRELMTPNEIEFFGRLNRALPGLNVFPQVSMAALIEPTATKRTARWTVAFNRIQAKRVDFVIADLMGKVRAVVELDDRTHNSSKDKDRDFMLQSAGLRVLRWQSRDKPSEAAISTAVVGGSEPMAADASATA